MNARGTRRPRGRAGPRPRTTGGGGRSRGPVKSWCGEVIAELFILGALAYGLLVIAGVL